MKNYTSETLPEYFQFVLEAEIDKTTFHATYPRNDYGFKNDNRIFVGWVKDNKPKATSYSINRVIELVNCGAWKIID